MEALKKFKVDDRRLLAYMATAGAVLAAAGPAEASVITTHIGNNHLNLSVPLGQTEKTSINGNVFSFINSAKWSSTGSGPLKTLYIANTYANAKVGGLAKMRSGLFNKSAPIGPNTFSSSSVRINKNGYIGFTIGSGTGLKFGWIEIANYINTSADFSYIVKDWGYEDIPNTPILAGDTVGVSAVPEPTSLALIAMGAGGLVLFRKRQKEKEA